MLTEKVKKMIRVRQINVDSLNNLKDELNSQDWNMLYNTTDVNTLYDNFIAIFSKLYDDESCPFKTILIKDKKEIDHGLQMVLRMLVEKNTDYMQFF